MPLIAESIVVEARARIMWGEETGTVVAYLRAKKIAPEEAANLIGKILAERSAAVRAAGLRKTVLGFFLILLPVAVYFLSRRRGEVHAKGFAATIVLGGLGLVLVTRGLSMVLNPRGITGDF